MNLSITNVVNVSVSTPPAGLRDVQVNDLAIFTKEAPVNVAITSSNPGIYKSPSDVSADWGSTSEVYAQAVAIFSQTPNILDGDGQLVIFPMANGDLLKDVIPAGQLVTAFFGALYAGYSPADAEIEAAAAACEPLRVKLFVSQYLTSSLTAVTGVFAILAGSSVPHTRMLLYTQAGSASGARLMAAAYAGRAMSVNFQGVATTTTMHLKQLATIDADSGITQAVLGRCKTLGVDTYPNIAGRPSVFSTGANQYWDVVYNLDWLVYALQVAGFNALAQTSTKLPQTEEGVAVLRGAYIQVLQQAVANGYSAPGTWTSPELFGNPDDLKQNILEQGWYIYSQPIAAQTQAARVARQAPIIRIALKEAGAIHSTSVIVSITA